MQRVSRFYQCGSTTERSETLHTAVSALWVARLSGPVTGPVPWYLPHSQSLGFAKLTERGTRGPAIFERREADSPAGHEGTRRADLPRTMLAVALLPGEGTGDGDALPRCFLRGACFYKLA